MKIHGFNKLTLLDYPKHIGATLFLGGCNFCCPYCQNGNLVTAPKREPFIPTADVLDFLRKRCGILEGVCISGGEPTLHAELPTLIKQIKTLGYLVKLDSNGTNPQMIQELAADGLIDYVAMDIKSSKVHYAKAAGCHSFSLDSICETVDFLMHGTLDYEFRTTVVRELHTAADFEAIGDWLAGCRAYFLQSFQASDNVLTNGLSSYSKEDLLAFKEILDKKIPRVALRGVD